MERTNVTDGETNPDIAQLKWLGIVTVGNEKINIFQEVGISRQQQIDYVLGDRLVTAHYHPE